MGGRRVGATARRDCRARESLNRSKEGGVTLSTCRCRVPKVMEQEKGCSTETVLRRERGNSSSHGFVVWPSVFRSMPPPGRSTLRGLPVQRGDSSRPPGLPKVLGTPAGFILATRSPQVHVHFIAQADRPSILQRRSSSADPDNVEAHVQHTTAIDRGCGQGPDEWSGELR